MIEEAGETANGRDPNGTTQTNKTGNGGWIFYQNIEMREKIPII